MFPNKHELFLAAHEHVVEHIAMSSPMPRAVRRRRRSGFSRWVAYMELLGNRDEILFQMQAHAAAGDPALREPVREEFMRLVEMSGA